MPNLSHLARYVPYYTFFILGVIWVLHFRLPVDTPRFDELVLDIGYAQQAWRWWTYMLLHSSFLHIVVNSASWVLFCGMVEIDIKTKRTILMHFVGVIGGACGVGWESRFMKSYRRVVGTSGGIYCLWASQIGNMILNWQELNSYRRAAYIWVLIAILIGDIVSAAVHYDPMLAYSNHIGGAITGIFAGGLFMKNAVNIPWERKYKNVSGICLGVWLIAGCVNLLIKYENLI
jgi:membrane associated rhomboid family serine protease